MTRKTEGYEKKFNKYILKFENYKPFSAVDFDKDKELQEIVEMYRNRKELALNMRRNSELSMQKRNKLSPSYLIREALRKYCKKTNNCTKHEGIERKLSKTTIIENIFRITHTPTALKIYDTKYVNGIPPVMLAGHYANNAPFKVKKYLIYDNIHLWHKYYIAVDAASRYIRQEYPDYKGRVKEKDKIILELNELKRKLKLLNIDSSNINLVIELLEYGINKAKTMKAKKLLSFNFPNIDNKEIALMVIKYTNPNCERTPRS